MAWLPVTLERLLGLYAWALVCALLGTLYLIARFYERSAHERSHYRLFLAPLALFAAAAARYLWIGNFAGDLAGDLLLFAAGLSLLGMGYYLQQLMMGKREK